MEFGEYVMQLQEDVDEESLHVRATSLVVWFYVRKIIGGGCISKTIQTSSLEQWKQERHQKSIV